MFRWGIIGTAGDARKFASGLRHTRDGVPALIVAPEASNAAAFARDFGITAITADLAAAVARPDIDAFYIATAPAAHRQAALQCLSAGKPVLIEKPLAASRADVEAIIAAAQTAGVFAMEGLWTLFLPLIADIKARLTAGDIGEVRSFSASFGLSNIADPGDDQFNAALGGGALLHRGIYPLALALHLLGPARLEASAATIGPTGVDDDAVLLLRHYSGALSTLRASLRSTQSNDVTIEGSHGKIFVNAPIYRPWQARMTRTAPVLRKAGAGRFERVRESALAHGLQQRLAGLRTSGTTITRHFTGNGYHYQAEALMTAVRAGQIQSSLNPLTDSLHIAAIIDAARHNWRTGA